MSRLAAVGAIAAVAVTLAVVVVHSGQDIRAASLLSVSAINEQAQADAQSFRSAFKAARMDKLTSQTQKQMAGKDAAVKKSLELAAAEQTVTAKQAESQFQEAQKQQARLDKQLALLVSKMASQRNQLAMALRELNGKEMLDRRASVMVPELSRGLSRVRADEAKIQKEKQKNAKAIKPIEGEIMNAQAVLKKSDDALTEDHLRTQFDIRQEKYSVARQNLEKARARVAAKQAAFFTQKAEEQGSGQGPQRAKFLKEAQSEHDKTSLLHAKAAEDANKAQVWRAKAAEAASGMRMMEADVVAARQRLMAERAAESRVHEHLGLRMMQRADKEEGSRLAAAMAAKKTMGGEVTQLSSVVRRGEEELGRSEQAFRKVRAADVAARREEAVGEQRMNAGLRLFTRDVAEAKDLQEARELHAAAAKQLATAAEAAGRVAADAVHGGVQEMQLGKYAASEATDSAKLASLGPTA